MYYYFFAIIFTHREKKISRECLSINNVVISIYAEFSFVSLRLWSPGSYYAGQGFELLMTFLPLLAQIWDARCTASFSKDTLPNCHWIIIMAKEVFHSPWLKLYEIHLFTCSDLSQIQLLNAVVYDFACFGFRFQLEGSAHIEPNISLRLTDPPS